MVCVLCFGMNASFGVFVGFMSSRRRQRQRQRATENHSTGIDLLTYNKMELCEGIDGTWYSTVQ
jgi:hypothetical protein